MDATGWSAWLQRFVGVPYASPPGFGRTGPRSVRAPAHLGRAARATRRYTATVADESMDMDLSLASLRADAGDLPTLLRLLVEQLSDALGSRLVVEHAGGLLRRSTEVRRLRISIADDEFEATSSGSNVECTVGHRSGGIRIRSERVDGGTWITRLTTALKAEAQRSEALRRALESIVIGGSS